MPGPKSNYLENLFVDGFLRGGCMTAAGAAGSTAVVKGLWTGSTSYVVGDIVVPHAAMTGAGGKLLRCVIAQSSGSTTTLAIGNPGTTVTDNAAAMWQVVATMPALANTYIALFTTTPTDAGGGTEVSGGSYARVTVASTLANWAGTQGATTTVSSTGTSGTTSNNGAVTFPAPTANWGVVTSFGIYDNLTAGNLLYYANLTTSKTVNNGDAAPSFAISALTLQEE